MLVSVFFHPLGNLFDLVPITLGAMEPPCASARLVLPSTGLEKTLKQAEKYTAVTTTILKGIKGACATAAAILPRPVPVRQKSKFVLYLETTFAYDLHRTVEEIRPTYAY